MLVAEVEGEELGDGSGLCEGDGVWHVLVNSQVGDGVKDGEELGEEEGDEGDGDILGEIEEGVGDVEDGDCEVLGEGEEGDGDVLGEVEVGDGDVFGEFAEGVGDVLGEGTERLVGVDVVELVNKFWSSNQRSHKIWLYGDTAFSYGHTGAPVKFIISWIQ